LASTLPLALALALAAKFAPGVAPDTMVTFAQLESGLDPLAVHDNSSARTYHPDSPREAVALAERLILSTGHSVDLGLLQVNFQGPTRGDLSIQEAFNPGSSMRTGAAILMEAYEACQQPGRSQEAALKCAASRYNSGGETPVGRRYAARIWHTAAQVVPSIGKIIHADFPSAALGTDTDTPGPEARPTTNTDAAPESVASVFARPARAGHELVFSDKR
jgi:type IV secretion system protein VirB1